MEDLETMEREAEALWDMSQEAQTAPRKRGRPKGSKSKPKTLGQTSDPAISGSENLATDDSLLQYAQDIDLPPDMLAALQEFEEDSKPKPRGGAKLTKLEKNLRTFYMSIGFVVTYVNSNDGLIIVTQANARAHEVYQYAQHHPEFKYFLETALERSDLVMLIGGHLTLAGAILRNHNIIPQDLGKALVERIKRRMSVQKSKAATSEIKDSMGRFRDGVNFNQWQ